MAFNYFDIIVVTIILFFAVKGLLRGFIKEIISILGIFASIWLAFTYYEILGTYITFFDNLLWRNVLAYIVIFVAGILFANIIMHILQRIFSAACLSWAEKFLGLCFGLLKGFFICAILATVAQGIFKEAPFMQGGFTLPYLQMIMTHVQPIIPTDFFDLVLKHIQGL